jgi:hypothetical protein
VCTCAWKSIELGGFDNQSHNLSLHVSSKPLSTPTHIFLIHIPIPISRYPVYEDGGITKALGNILPAHDVQELSLGNQLS